MTIRFYVDSRAAGKEGNLYAVIVHDNNRFKYTVKPFVKLSSDKWLVDAQRVKGKKSEDLELNDTIDEKRREIRKVWEGLETELDREPTLKELEQVLKGKTSVDKKKDEIPTLSDLLTMFLAEKQHEFAKKTLEKYEALKTYLDSFKKSKNKNLRVDKVDYSWLVDFRTYILNTPVKGRKIKNQSVNSHLYSVRAILRHYYDTNPKYRKFIDPSFMILKSLPETRNRREFLELKEILFINALQITNQYIRIARDAYVFNYFTGQRSIDLTRLIDNNFVVREDEEGNKQTILRYKMHKVELPRPVEVPVNEIAQSIYNRYKGGEPTLFNFIPKRKEASFKNFDEFSDSNRRSYKRRVALLFEWLVRFNDYVNEAGLEQFLSNEFPIQNQAKEVASWFGINEPNLKHIETLKTALANIKPLKTQRQYVYKEGNQRVEITKERWEMLTAHTARHGFGYFLTEKGLTLDERKELMGHKESKTTEIYSHLMEGTAVAAARKVLNLPVMKVA